MHDTKCFEDISIDQNDEDEEFAFAINLPWNRHHEPKCKEAKLAELERFDEYDAYEEVCK